MKESDAKGSERKLDPATLVTMLLVAGPVEFEGILKDMRILGSGVSKEKRIMFFL